MLKQWLSEKESAWTDEKRCGKDVTQEVDSQSTPWGEELRAGERWCEGLEPGDQRTGYPGQEALKEDQEWKEGAGHDGVCFGLVEFRSFLNIHVMTGSQGAKKSPSLERSQDERQGVGSAYPISRGHYGFVLCGGHVPPKPERHICPRCSYVGPVHGAQTPEHRWPSEYNTSPHIKFSSSHNQLSREKHVKLDLLIFHLAGTAKYYNFNMYTT